ncbi:MAG TPA: maleylpyruvate isomerase N-terminal domain-containing protein [Ornithinibacter sp.]|nr:maleylpyruvate isomerase N-terminal domain-containing protein [Ornithinibacter sp.]
MAERLIEVFPEVARVAAHLVRDPRVARRWHDESACAGMTVGGLANHLASQAGNVVRLLAAVPRDADAITALEHYRRAAWVHTGPDDEVNVGIRASADEEASAGPTALVERVRRDLDALPSALAPVLDGSREPDTVLIPWQGWSLSSADFVLTRTMEVLVHSDDLAASIGVDTPRFPEVAADAVLGLLASVAADRHGQAAVLRALSRPQRADGSVSAF